MAAPLDENRLSAADIARKSPDGRKALISRADRAMPVGFHITEELQNQTGGEIGHGQPLDRLVEGLADIGQQQAERVPIAGAGVLGQIPFSYDIFDEEAPQPRARK